MSNFRNKIVYRPMEYSLCFRLVTEIKEEYPNINEHYKNYLLESYEDTYYPEKIMNSSRAAYVERNYEMIDNSRFCIVYYDKIYAVITRKSGTKIALDYAVKHKKDIVRLPLDT